MNQKALKVNKTEETTKTKIDSSIFFPQDRDMISK
mgnify:CR=1 FL=1